jgi:predicted ribosome-associated RNA-binding protein Tma20
MSFSSAGHISLLVVNNEPIFFNYREKDDDSDDVKYFPTLRLLHKCKHTQSHIIIIIINNNNIIIIIIT